MTEKNEWKYSELKSEDKDLVWLPKPLCKKIKELDNGAAIEKEIMKYFDSAMGEISTSVECMDDEVIRYRGFMIAAKQQFKKVTDDMLEESYAMWEDWSEKMPKLNTEIEKFRKLFNPIHDDLVEIDKMMKDVNTYGVREFMKVVTFMEELNGNNTTEMIKFLVENYKRE